MDRNERYSYDNLDDYQKTAIWIVGAMDELSKWKFISGPAMLNPPGVALFDQIEAQWQPDDLLLEVGFTQIAPYFGVAENAVGFYLFLLKEYRDHRDRMDRFDTFIKEHPELEELINDPEEGEKQ